MFRKSKAKATHTRTISPMFGMLGLFGFTGFLGFMPNTFGFSGMFSAPFPFLFFAFFGFFGFYYEGKMSNTMIDERFLSNKYRAGAIANKTSWIIVIVVSVISISILRISTYNLLSILIATIGITFGLSAFLQQFLLYRFETEE